MKTNKKVFWALVAALAAGILWWSATGHHPSFGGFHHGMDGQSDKAGKYYCPMHPQVVSDKPGDCPICHMRLVKRTAEAPTKSMASTGPRKIRFYRHPMTPEVTSSVPAKDEMGMDYIPVYEEETKVEVTEGYAPVTVSAEKRQLVGIRTTVVEKRPLVKTVRPAAKVAYDPELYQAQAEYIQAAASAKISSNGGGAPSDWAKTLLESTRTKLALLGLNETMIDEIGRRESPDKSLLVSVPGQAAWIYARIFEHEIAWVKVGDIIEIEVPALPGTVLSGEIRSIDTVVDSLSRTLRVRAMVKNEVGHLKPDLFVNATIQVDLGRALAVPEEAIFFSGKSTFVFVDQGEGILEPRRVVLGAKAEDWHEVKEGLKEGEEVVSSGNFLVDSESRLKAALSGMGTGHSHD